METLELKAIENNVLSWISRYMPGFTFRQYQLEYIVKIINSVLNDEELVVVQAPTGSGKSIITIICAGVLNKFYRKTSYILCSDLYLWQQYADVIKQRRLPFGKLKGSRGNYLCSVSGEDLQVAPCKLAQISYASLFDDDWCMANKWECACDCEYIFERKNALSSPVTLLTYQLYFRYMDMANDIDKNYAKLQFTKRDVIFCDECHNIPDLCQDFGTITIDFHWDNEKLSGIMDYCKSEGMYAGNVTNFINNVNTIRSKMYDIPFTDRHTHLALLQDYYETVRSELYLCTDALNQKFSVIDKNAKVKQKLTKKEHKILNWTDDLDRQLNTINTYLTYAKAHPDYIVKSDNKNDPITNSKPYVTYKFAREDAWVYAFLLRHQPSNVMLSATVGAKDVFDDSVGTHFLESKKSTFYNIPSTFDYSKSPIFYIPGNKMSRDCIIKSLPINAAIINRILKSDKHKHEKGIIHTGSYKNAYDLYNLLSPDVKKRVFIYGNAKEKTDVLMDFEDSHNGVLIGPTLTEGIDFPEDGCRFIIIMKIPYPFFGDNLVKAKIEVFPKWYNAETSKNVIQGIGRGNRTPNDWSTTYILDGCFGQLFNETYQQYPEEMRARIKQLNS